MSVVPDHVMDLAIHTCILPLGDPAASLAFWRDALGFEVRSDLEYGGRRWITVGPSSQPNLSVMLGPPAADPSVTDEERSVVLELMEKGTYGCILLVTDDLDGTFERLQDSDAVEVVQEPIARADGMRDCAFRDPAGTLVRIQESRGAAS